MASSRTVPKAVLRWIRDKEGADYVKITVTGGSTRISFPLRPSFTVDEMT